MDHLDGVHQSWKGLDDSNGSSLIQRLDEFLEDTKILHIVLSLIELIRKIDFFHLVFSKEVGDVFFSRGSSLCYIWRFLFFKKFFYKLEIVTFKLFT
jgi:hypothetical protein